MPLFLFRLCIPSMSPSLIPIVASRKFIVEFGYALVPSIPTQCLILPTLGYD